MRNILSECDDENANIDELSLALDGVQIDFNEKIESCAVVVKEMLGEAAGLKLEIDRLAARKKSLDNNAEGLKDYMRHHMEATGIGKVKTALFTVTLGAPGQSVMVPNAELLPKELQTIKISGDLKAIGLLLKAKKEVTGASLVQSKPRLTIK